MSGTMKEEFYTEESIELMAQALQEQYSEFEVKKFIGLIYDSQWENREIKQRMRHVATCLIEVLPSSFEESVDILIKAAPQVGWWESMSFPDYVELYGQEKWETSMYALKELTKRCSSEFAIRRFLINKPEKTTAYLVELTRDDNEDVRRYASEGCRPRHPWGIGLPHFKKDPSPILPILENLKDDESEYVRRSVANNLNDIAKYRPEIVLEMAERWYGKNENTNKMVKHACRTLLKAGNRRALEIFGYGKTDHLKVSNFQIDKVSIDLGESVIFTYDLFMTGTEEADVRMEYGVDYVKANGSLSRKVFQISTKTFSPGTRTLKKRHKFEDRVTRRHYKGIHHIALIINGEEMAKGTVEIRKL